MRDRQATGGEYKGKRILVPYFYHYYLFDYLKFLVPKLSEDGFDVTVLTYQKKIAEIFNPNEVTVTYVPGILRYLIARAGRILCRICLWLLAWCWGLLLRRSYDFVVLPGDNKPVWYVLSCVMPSLTCHNTTELISIDLTLERDRYKGRDGKDSLLHRLFLLIDTIVGGRFLPRWPGQINKYTPKKLVVDRLMGYWSQNFYCGFGKVDYLTVSGHEIGDNYEKLGLDKTRIIVTGSPNYDFLDEVKRDFGETEQKNFRENLGMTSDDTLFSLFLSPSSFTEAQMAEVLLVVREIDSVIANSFFVLKFHPKTGEKYPLAFRSNLQSLGKRLLILTEYRGEEHNAQLVLASDYLLQKQSTVGFIAILLRKNIISYNILDTDYEDDMYKVLNASAHVESKEELRKVLLDIRNGDFADLRGRQRTACHRFCLDTHEANRNISKVIQGHFGG